MSSVGGGLAVWGVGCGFCALGFVGLGTLALSLHGCLLVSFCCVVVFCGLRLGCLGL